MSRDETAGLRAAQLRLGRLPGYVRRPDPARRSGDQGHTYKKGWEVRFTARSEAEIAEIRDLVVAAGFAPARPFFKGHQLIQPVYGMAAVQAYLAARQAAEEHAARTALGRRRRGAPAGRGTGAGHGTNAGHGTSARPARSCEENAAATAVGAPGAPGTTASSAAATTTAAQPARRRTVDAFPSQVERNTATADRISSMEAHPHH
ncbi:hypothetical protein F7Q99_09025 [Streptomyces kaniharaensis]|uniref:Uncharacterized protein n=1 Tax=Streptomyces kaniharaensis TaxID=212423 RepID=A0A6N7KNV8_9ACTN|nr:hypothetical protein [Streptomyces kaniharaensis]MQS12425.1 hypothetical protein [Streptomyces kaniharaensis]